MFASPKLVSVQYSPGRPAQLLPILLVKGSDGSVSVCIEALLWAGNLLGLGELTGKTHTEKDVSQRIKTLAMFRNFVGTAFPDFLPTAQEMDYAVYAFCVCRHAGARSMSTPDAFKALGWRPAGQEVVKRELKELVEFFRYCVDRFGYAWPLAITQDGARYDVPLFRMRDLAKQSGRDFFVHLQNRRSYWAEQRGSVPLALPAIVRKSPRPSQARNHPGADEVWPLIHAERNPCFKALWLAAAFGGPRISEQLNSWQVDHRPGSDQPLFFETALPNALPLYLRTHPEESTFIRHPQRREMTRTQYLADHYGERPRNVRSDRYHAGWKGTVFYGVKFTHMVMWSDPFAAQLFAETVQEIHEFHRKYQTSRRHPWFFVNLADRSGIHLGNPVTMARVASAFDAAVRRTGVEPHEWGRNLHGLRHFYKHTMEKTLGLSPRAVQVAMGHSSIRSQEDYDRTLESAADELSGAFCDWVRGPADAIRI